MQAVTSRLMQLLSSRKQVRYITSGVASEIIEYSSFLLLIATTHALFVSNSISFIAGIASGYVFHKYWSFKGAHYLKTRHQVGAYLLVAAINLVLTNLVIGLCADHLHFAPALAKILTMALSATWTYAILNRLVFRNRTD